jgi:hypothetical protein
VRDSIFVGGAADHLPGRTDAQCLHRWQKVLNPEVSKAPWSKEEDARIVQVCVVVTCFCHAPPLQPAVMGRTGSATGLS